MWATDGETELRRITKRLQAYDAATYTHVENGVTFVEARDPDHGAGNRRLSRAGGVAQDADRPRFGGR